MKLSEHFDSKELCCKCCGQLIVSDLLLEELENIRAFYNKKYGEAVIKITSGNRCEKNNARVNGAPRSQHLLGHAVDFKVFARFIREFRGLTQITADIVYEDLCEMYPEKYGIGLYQNRNHFDVRESCARWEG